MQQKAEPNHYKNCIAMWTKNILLRNKIWYWLLKYTVYCHAIYIFLNHLSCKFSVKQRQKYRCVILFQVYVSRVCFILALKPLSKNWTQCQIKQVQKNKWRTGQTVRTFKILIGNLRCSTSARQWLECICSCRYMTDFERKEKKLPYTAS